MADRKRFRLRLRDHVLELGKRTRIMGVVNVTPDSFYDGGRFLDPSRALEHCCRLAEEGADLLDIGGESSRPGAAPVSADEEMRRVLPVVERVVERVALPVSIDTWKSTVARAALEAGVQAVNDISAFRLDPQMPRTVSQFDAGVILMHMRGDPSSMQTIPHSPNILGEIRRDLKQALEIASAHQIARDRIVLDPGIGFGKTTEDNLLILNRLDFLEEFHLPVLVGTSRKSFLGRILGSAADKEVRLWGTAASVAAAILRGAHMVRVHDVEQIRTVVEVSDAILAESPVS